MSTTSGAGRLLSGSAADRVQRGNLTEFRGTLWEAVNDWFFGYNAIDYDWSDTGDSTKFSQWTFSADANMVAQVAVLPADHHAEIVGASGDADGLSNLRELHTIPETANWGVAHVQCEVYGGPKFLGGVTLDESRITIKPQHGLGMRAQEDTKRRTIIAWHDIAFGLPQSINLGVWSGNLDGSGFLNRQINLAMDLDEVYTPSACAQACDDTAGLVFDGTAANWSTADDAALEMGNGDWTAKVDVTVSDWTPAAQQSLFSKYNTVGNNRSYRLYLTTTGQLVVATTTDGTGTTLQLFTLDAAGTAIVAGLANGSRRTVVIDYDADNGSGNRAVTFYLAESWMGPFVQLGATITNTGTATLFNGTATLELGAVNATLGERLNGRIHQFELRKARFDSDGNSPTAPVADVRAQWETNAVTSFSDNSARTWTRAGTASLANTQVPTGTATIGAHTLRVGDRVNITVGDEVNVTALQRTGGQDCQCTLPAGHGLTTGSLARLLFSSDSSFDGTFPVTVSGNTMTWTDAGSNVSGHTSLVWDNTFDRQTATVTAVGATTIDYETFGKTNASIVLAANSRVQREFPYYMELKVEGTVASVRCWGRHQSPPTFMDQTRALICDLTKAARAFNVTLRERTSNVATLTIGTHDLIIGDRVNIAAVDATFNATNRIVTALTDTTFSYANTGSDVGSTASSGTATAVGSGTASAIIDNPCPTGSGRVAFVNAHLGTNDLCKCVYGPFFGDNDPNSTILAIGLDQTTNYIRGQFTFPQVTAGMTGTPATATPSVIAQSFTLPASTESVGAGPAVLAQSFIEPQSAVNVAAGPVVTARSFVFPATTESVAAGPAVLPVTFSLPAPTESVGAGPAVIARALTLPQAVESVGAAPAVIPLAFALPQAVPVTAGNATALPAVLAAIAAFPQALAQGGATVSPAVLAAISAFGQAVESVGTGPLVIAQAFTFPQATALTAGNATVTPLVIDRLFSFGATAESVGAGPLVIARSFAFPQATPSLPALASPAVLARSFVLPATAVTVAAAATPAAIAVLAALARPGVNIGVTPASLAMVMLFGHPTSGAFPPDPNPEFIEFLRADGLVTFTNPGGVIVFKEDH